MSENNSERLTDTTPEAIQTGLERLLGRLSQRFDDGSRVLVLPDVHYPHHPSTGLVTNPDVVLAFVDQIDAEVAIGIPSSEFIEANRAGRYLGYERVAERSGARLVDLDTAERERVTVPFVDGSVSLDVPTPLRRDVVVPIPTLRRSPRLGIATGMVTLARAVTESPSRKEVLATVRRCWPTLSILDATFAYDGNPRKMELLLASEDVVALSAQAAHLLGVDRSDVPHLEPDRSPPSPLGMLTGTAERSPKSDGNDVMSKGYRLYAQLAGDAVPPQMLAGGDGE